MSHGAQCVSLQLVVAQVCLKVHLVFGLHVNAAFVCRSCCLFLSRLLVQLTQNELKTRLIHIAFLSAFSHFDKWNGFLIPFGFDVYICAHGGVEWLVAVLEVVGFHFLEHILCIIYPSHLGVGAGDPQLALGYHVGVVPVQTAHIVERADAP